MTIYRASQGLIQETVTLSVVSVTSGTLEKVSPIFSQEVDHVPAVRTLTADLGILYNLVFAKATMDSYIVPLGKPGQFNGMSFYWSAIFPAEMEKFQPVYEVMNNGQ